MNIDKVKEYLDTRIKSVEKSLDELKTDMGNGIKVINVTGLTKKEKEEVLNKRNCLLVQRHCYQEISDKIKEM